MNTKSMREVARTGVVVAAGATGVLLSTGLAGREAIAQAPTVLVGHELRIVDARGATRARLALTPDDVVVLFELSDARGVTKVQLQVLPDGGPVALFWDKDGGGSYDTRFEVPSINFLDRNNMIRASLPSSSQTTALHGLPALPILPNPFGVSRTAASQGGRTAQSVSQADVDWLRSEIDRLNSRLNDVTARLNLLIR